MPIGNSGARSRTHRGTSPATYLLFQGNKTLRTSVDDDAASKHTTRDYHRKLQREMLWEWILKFKFIECYLCHAIYTNWYSILHPEQLLHDDTRMFRYRILDILVKRWRCVRWMWTVDCGLIMWCNHWTMVGDHNCFCWRGNGKWVSQIGQIYRFARAI